MSVWTLDRPLIELAPLLTVRDQGVDVVAPGSRGEAVQAKVGQGGVTQPVGQASCALTVGFIQVYVVILHRII